MIEVEQLAKSFGAIDAVNGVSFSVKSGEVLGFLGPNGAGKSTTMKMLTCFYPPTAGTARIKGFDIIENPMEVRRSLGYLPENAPLYADMTVVAFLDFIGRVRGFRGAELKRAVTRMMGVCQLEKVAYQPIHTLSKGYRQRVCFAQALLHDPDVLILDEPTDGLDPNQKHMVRELITSISHKKAVILSTHILEEVEAICSRAIIIAEGKILADGSPEDLKKKSECYGAVVLTVVGDLNLKLALSKLDVVRRVEQLAGTQDGRVRFRVYPKPEQNLALPLADFLRDQKLQAEEFFTEQGKLDQVFRSITREAALKKKS